MKKGNNTEFEQMIRSTLYSGTEDVPEGMWAAIESRLGAGGAAAGRISRGSASASGRWKWIFGLSALAAVIVIAVLMIPGGGNVHPSSLVAESAIADRSLLASAAPMDEMPQPQLNAVPAVRDAAIAPTIEGEDVTQEQPLPSPASPSSPAFPSSPSPAPLQSQTPSPESPTDATGDSSPSPGPVADNAAARQLPFAEPQLPSRKRGRLQLGFGGIAGGNFGERSSAGTYHTATSVFSSTQESIIETAALSFMPPIAAALTLRWNINDRLAVASGISYIYMGRRLEGDFLFEGALDPTHVNNIHNAQHYLGIPLDLFFRIVTFDRWSIWANAGGQVEKCLVNRYSFPYSNHSIVCYGNVAGVQWSVGAGISFEFNIIKSLKAFANPCFKYYFPNYLQPRNIRTMQPFQFNCALGLRFDI